MIDRSPTLDGRLVRLRPMRADDWPALFAVAADPAIWSLHPAHDRWQEDVFRDYFEDGLRSGGALVIEDTATGTVIGSSRYGDHDPECDRIEIGWTYLARAYWGGTINREVKELMVAHALRAVTTVIFRVAATNLRSRRALEKFGAKATGESSAIVIHGNSVPHLVYAVDRVPD